MWALMSYCAHRDPDAFHLRREPESGLCSCWGLWEATLATASVGRLGASFVCVVLNNSSSQAKLSLLALSSLNSLAKFGQGSKGRKGYGKDCHFFIS